MKFDRAHVRSAILTLTQQRGPRKSICPSEAAKAACPDEWRSQMEHVRQVARELAAEGRIIFLQRGKPVDPTRATGPIRLRATISDGEHPTP